MRRIVAGRPSLRKARSQPTLAPAAFMAMRGGELPPPLDESGATFWFSARVALFQAVAALGLEAGDGVALPAFCCGSEVEPFTLAGLVPHFFRVTETLDPEPESFGAALERSAAALVTHYFGFAAELGTARRLCDEAGVPLIEDCAHGLYSRTPDDWLGAGADAAVFSIAKTLPVPDGGALLLGPRAVPSPAAGTTPPRRVISKRTRSLLVRHLQAHRLRPVSWAAHLPHAARTRLGLTKRGPSRDTQEGLYEVIRLDPELVRAEMSARSQRLFAQAPHEQVRVARRRHYQRLLAAVRGVPDLEPLYPDLPDGTCPLALPVVAADPDTFRRRLGTGSGLGAQQMWPWFHPVVSWEDFPFEATLKRSLFILPVHQSLHRSEVDSMVAELEGWATEPDAVPRVGDPG